MPRMRRYLVMSNTYNRDYDGDDPVEIGRIVDAQGDGNPIVGYIIFDKNDYKKSNFRMRAVMAECEDGEEEFWIVVDSVNKQLLYENPKIFDSLAMHELGHYLNGDLDPRNFAESYDFDAFSKRRMDAILSGTVEPHEAKADEFACRECGKHAFNMGIDYMIKRRRERNDEVMELAIREFELRKKTARKLRL